MSMYKTVKFLNANKELEEKVIKESNTYALTANIMLLGINLNDESLITLHC